MPLVDIYDTGTASVDNDSTTVTFGGGAVVSNVKAGDLFWPLGQPPEMVGEDTVFPFDELTLLRPWAGPDLTDAVYMIVKAPWARVTSIRSAEEVRELLEQLQGAPLVLWVIGAEPEPDLGDENQLAAKWTGGQLIFWQKQSGVWVSLGAAAGINFRGDWDSVTAWVTRDIVRYNGVLWHAQRPNTNVVPGTSSADWIAFLPFPNSAGFTVVFDAGGAVLSTGPAGDFPIPFDCTITGWVLLAEGTGSVVVDIWRDTYANFPPTVADTICGGNKPTISSGSKNRDITTLTGWSKTLTIGQTLRFNIDSATLTRVTLTLLVDRNWDI